jgi:hypothetical protein
VSRVVQLSRRKGWRKPDDVVVVARPTKWGNPFPFGDDRTRAEAVERYREWVQGDDPEAVWIRDHVHELAGKRLACWCPQPGPCHALVLAELADEADD